MHAKTNEMIIPVTNHHVLTKYPKRLFPVVLVYNDERIVSEELVFTHTDCSALLKWT